MQFVPINTCHCIALRFASFLRTGNVACRAVFVLRNQNAGKIPEFYEMILEDYYEKGKRFLDTLELRSSFTRNAALLKKSQKH